MKNTSFLKLALLFVVITSLFAACSKRTNVNPSSSTVFGKWEARSAYGGLNGFDTTLVAGNGNIVQFFSDSTYKQYQSGSVIISGTYHIVKFSQTGNDFLGTLYFSSQASEAIQLQSGKLILGNSNADGISTSYVKLN